MTEMSTQKSKSKQFTKKASRNCKLYFIELANMRSEIDSAVKDVCTPMEQQR